MQKAIIFFLISLVLLVSCASPALKPTKTPLPSPTITQTPTTTFTPQPTNTFTPIPTETPGPMWQMANFGEFPHAVNDKGQETFNFLEDFSKWPVLPDMSPATMRAYHAACKQIRKSDGSLLVAPMNTPENAALPPLVWNVSDASPFGKELDLANNNMFIVDNPRAKFVCGSVVHFQGSAANWVSVDFVLATWAVEDRSQSDWVRMVSGIFRMDQVTGIHQNRLKGFFQNGMTLDMFMNFNADASDSLFLDMKNFMEKERWFDKVQYEQALMDLASGIPNTYLDSHGVIGQSGGRTWVPVTPTP